MEEDKKEIAKSGSDSNFFSDPWKVGMAIVIILLLAYIATTPGVRQTPSGGNQTTNQTINQTGNLNATSIVKVNLIVVNDYSCILCDTSSIVASLQNVIPGLTVTNVSYSSAEGMALLQKYNATGVPLYVFDSSIAQDPSFSNLSMYLYKSGSTYALEVQPVKLLIMHEQNNTIELFVMSMGQYGVRAENNTKEVLDALPDLKFTGIRFIATDLGNGSFSSLRGQDEINEDLRQVCIMRYYPDRILNYTSCIAADYNNSATIWQNCSSTNGMNTSMIEVCSIGDEGKSLLSDNVALSNQLAIYTSPTILLNNDTLVDSSFASSAEAIKEVVCAYKQMDGCNKTLSGGGINSLTSGGTG